MCYHLNQGDPFFAMFSCVTESVKTIEVVEERIHPELLQ